MWPNKTLDIKKAFDLLYRSNVAPGLSRHGNDSDALAKINKSILSENNNMIKMQVAKGMEMMEDDHEDAGEDFE